MGMAACRTYGTGWDGWPQVSAPHHQGESPVSEGKEKRLDPTVLPQRQQLHPRRATMTTTHSTSPVELGRGYAK